MESHVRESRGCWGCWGRGYGSGYSIKWFGRQAGWVGVFHKADDLGGKGMDGGML